MALAGADTELLYDTKSNEIVFTPTVEEGDVVVRHGVKLRSHGSLVVVDGATRVPLVKGTDFDPAVHIVVWRATAGDEDVVVAHEYPVVISGAVVLRPVASLATDGAAGTCSVEEAMRVAVDSLPSDDARVALRAKDASEALPERKAAKRGRDGSSSAAGRTKAFAAGPTEGERRQGSTTLQLTVLGKGSVRRSHLHAVVMACITDLNMTDKYVTKTQPCGLKKIAYVGNGPEKRFASLQEAVAHLKQCSGVDVVARLASVPSTFPTVEAMPMTHFVPVSSGSVAHVESQGDQLDAQSATAEQGDEDAVADASEAHGSDDGEAMD